MNLLLLALAACTGGKPAVPPDPAPVVEPEPAAAPEPVAVAPTEGPWGDHYDLMAEPMLKGLVLTLDVRYGGGCETHAFTTRPSPRTSEAPTQQRIVLHHDANDDHCRAIKYEHLTIPLDDLIEGCTESVVLVVPPGPESKGEFALPLSSPKGCD